MHSLGFHYSDDLLNDAVYIENVAQLNQCLKTEHGHSEFQMTFEPRHEKTYNVFSEQVRQTELYKHRWLETGNFLFLK